MAGNGEHLVANVYVYISPDIGRSFSRLLLAAGYLGDIFYTHITHTSAKADGRTLKCTYWKGVRFCIVACLVEMTRVEQAELMKEVGE